MIDVPGGNIPDDTPPDYEKVSMPVLFTCQRGDVRVTRVCFDLDELLDWELTREMGECSLVIEMPVEYWRRFSNYLKEHCRMTVDEAERKRKEL